MGDFAGAVFIPFFWLLFWAHWFRLRQLRLVIRAGWILVLLELCAFACLRQYLLGSLLPFAWMHPMWLLTVTLRVAFAILLLAVALVGIWKDRAGGWIALPAMLALGVGLFSVDIEFLGIPVNYFPFGIRVGTDIIAWLVLAVIVIGLVLRRFLQAQFRQQVLDLELQQARNVQEMLIPKRPPQVPGFAVESVYIPASEVGGDFFQVLPGEDGSLLIVVGDVSGKGLKAAMTVSTIIGALRGCVIREPAEVLANLNRVLHGQITGFATCVAAWITAGGTMTIANAGHIPPYRNGEELAVPGGLPLGIVEAGKYEETQFEIAAGNRLTFVSDGVVEATNEKKELFGFARTQAISLQPAQAIAEAAKIFGQEDDISVLSVTRT